MTIHDSPADIAHEIFDLASLLGVLLAHPDAETVTDGMHRVVLTIRERAGVLRETFEAKAE
jgi:hypothetical protein